MTVDPFKFQPFPKVPRLSRDVVITEKLDGANASVHFIPCTASVLGDESLPKVFIEVEPGVNTMHAMLVGSRNNYITPAKDNFGFAKWAYEHAQELAGLGVGSHYGEWWGPGIQRGYGIREKRFSLFNVRRWLLTQDTAYLEEIDKLRTLFPKAKEAPLCCDVVPVLAVGDFDTGNVRKIMDMLERKGSFASPGFMRPEGIMIYHTAAGQYFKKTFEKDEKGKGE